EWDGWPNGDFKTLFSIAFAAQHNNLNVHWACQPVGGRGGSAEADNWQQGKPTGRRCLGAIECQDDACSVVIRPQTRPAAILKQLEKPCICGVQLVHHSCGIISTLHTWLQQNPTTGPLRLLVGHPGRDGPADSVAKISPVLVNADRIKYENHQSLS
ncbi:hypothetical protein C8R43DRAFT_860387, partial [Mycena crocata]